VLATRTLRLAKAGHLPPLLIRDGTALAALSPRGPMLGADPDATARPPTPATTPAWSPSASGDEQHHCGAAGACDGIRPAGATGRALAG
jgi:hypothetical protein